MDAKLKTTNAGAGVGVALSALAGGVLLIVLLSLFFGLVFWWLLPVATAGAFAPGFVQCAVGYFLARLVFGQRGGK